MVYNFFFFFSFAFNAHKITHLAHRHRLLIAVAHLSQFGGRFLEFKQPVAVDCFERQVIYALQPKSNFLQTNFLQGMCTCKIIKYVFAIMVPNSIILKSLCHFECIYKLCFGLNDTWCFGQNCPAYNKNIFIDVLINLMLIKG